MTSIVGVLAVELLASSASADLPAESRSEVTVEVSEPAYDGFQSLLDTEAHVALADGDYSRAWHFFWRLTLIDPFDTRALRECGRIAHAMGRFSFAVETLGRVDVLGGGLPDPELHYLRGESLLALGKKREGLAELARAEAEIGPAPTDRRHVLWLARIHALRAELPRALAFYDRELDKAGTTDAYVEVTLLRIEAFALAKDWTSAEEELRAFLKQQPDHPRGREMLAWVLDARGKLDESIAVRSVLAQEWVDHPRRTAEYAASLERSFRYPEALENYREADRLGVGDLRDEIGRLERRLAPEIAGGMSFRDDPSGAVEGWMAGASMPFARRARVTLTGTQESADAGIVMTTGQTSAATAMMVLDGRHGGLLGIGATAHQTDIESSVGGSALVRTSPRNKLQVHGRVDLNLPWRESASTIRNGGVYDAANLQVYLGPESRRYLFSGGAQLRRLQLTSNGPDGMAAGQLFGFAGLDVVPWQRSGRAARAEIFDEEMLAPRALASSAVLSYRHYEMSSDDPFGDKLVLIERSSIDELSGIVRHVLDERGRLGAELRGGVGYDWGREVRIWRAGTSALLSATASSRLTFDYDVASESGTGLSGRRHAGSVVLHVDL